MCRLSKEIGTYQTKGALVVILIIQQYEFYFDKIYDTFSSPINLEVRWFTKDLHALLKRICNPQIFPLEQPFIPNVALILILLRTEKQEYASTPLVLSVLYPWSLNSHLLMMEEHEGSDWRSVWASKLTLIVWHRFDCIFFGLGDGRPVVNENTCPMEVLLFDNQKALVNNQNMVFFID